MTAGGRYRTMEVVPCKHADGMCIKRACLMPIKEMRLLMGTSPGVDRVRLVGTWSVVYNREYVCVEMILV